MVLSLSVAEPFFFRRFVASPSWLGRVSFQMPGSLFDNFEGIHGPGFRGGSPAHTLS